MVDRPPMLPSETPEQPKTRTQSGSEDTHRTEAYIGSFVRVRAQELGITVSDGQLREITAGITGRLTPAQRSGAASINMADVSGMIEADLRRQSEVGKPVNMYSADAARLEAQNGGGRWGANAALFAGSSIRGRDGGTDSSSGEAASSRRFDGMNGLAGLTPSEKLTHSYALQQGVMWAAENREILKLGTAAIDIIKQTQLRKETLTSLKDAGFSTKGSIGIASMLHERGKDANKDGKAFATKVKELGDQDITAAIEARAKLQVPAPNETPEQAEARKAQIPAADDHIRDAANAHIQKKPRDAAKVKDVTDTIGVELKRDEVATKATADKSAKAEAKVAMADAALADLNGPEPAQKPETPPPAANAAKPDKPASVKPVQRTGPQPK